MLLSHRILSHGVRAAWPYDEQGSRIEQSSAATDRDLTAMMRL